MPICIDTPDDFRAVRAQLDPVHVQSKSHGPILVPCVTTILVRPTLLMGWSDNPNSVAPDKMALLHESIIANGFAFPVVTIWDDEASVFRVIDGHHRTVIGGADWLDLDYVPVVVLTHDMTKRMIATVQFNKARGVHQVDLDAELIRKLIEQGLTEEEVAARLCIDLETVHRYKQITGVAELFRNADLSRSWEMVDEPT